MITIQTANQIVQEELRKWERKGYQTSVKFSQTTQSSYYCVSDGAYSVAFRVSDHPTKKSSICTLDLSYKTDVDNVRRFVANRVHGLRKRAVQTALGM